MDKTKLVEIKKGQTGTGLLIENDGYISADLGNNKKLLEDINSARKGGDEFYCPHPFILNAVLQRYGTENANGRIYPEAILKRIMKLNKPDDEEYVEKNFEGSLKELLWHLIKEQLSDQLQIKVEQADVMEAAKEATRMQFAQYGMMNIPDESLEQYATEMLKNKEQAEGLVSRTVENKIAKAAQDVLTLKKKEVSLEEFNNLFQSEKTA